MRHFQSAAQQRLLEGEKGIIDEENIVFSPLDEIFYDNVQLAAVGYGKTGSADKIPCFIKVQLQRNGKGQSCCLAGLVLGIVADFGK